MAKQFASQGDLAEKRTTFTEIGRDVYAFTAEGDPNSGVIIGEELASRLGLNMGDIVGATAASGTTRSLRIVGLVKKGNSQLGSSNGYMLLREAQSLLGRPFIINRIGIKLLSKEEQAARKTKDNGVRVYKSSGDEIKA